MDEYIIINKSSLLKRIDELKKAQRENHLTEAIWVFAKQELQKILSQSTPLIPEVEKLIVMSSTSNIDFLPDRVEKIKQDYISNLKLDI